MNFIRPRLRKPLLRAIAGTGVAAAWAIGSPHWWLAIVIEIATLGYSVGWYVWAGQDSDEGALLGSRADERQKLVGQQALALAAKFALIGAYIGFVVTLALKPIASWQFALVLAIGGLGYLFGLSEYGVDPSDSADDPDDADGGLPASSRATY
jgi:uncharacterized membrane protein